MSKNNTKLLDAKHNSVNRKRLYKSKGQWKVYGVSTMALGAAFVGLTYQTTNAHADALSDLQAAASTKSANSSGGLNNAASNVNSAINAANTTVANQANSVDSATALQTSPASNLSSHTASSITVDATRQAGNMSATQAVNNAIDSTVNQYQSTNNAVGGSFVQRQSNDVSSQTGSQIVSNGQDTVNKLNVVGSANQLVSDTLNSAGSITSKVGGSATAGSTINATNLTPQQISSVAQKGQDMLSVTGSANQTLGSTINANISNLNAAGASLYKGLAVNTADNMTIPDVQSNLRNQLVNLSTVGSANQVINTARSSNSASVKAVNGVLNAGSAIDATSMTPDQIISLMTKQATMLSATGSADSQITNAVNSNSGFILSAGGNLTQTGNYNTANNMTTNDIASLLNAQLQNINATGSAAIQISSTNAYNTPFINAAGGKVTSGSTIDVTGMSPEVISAITASLNSNVSLVGSADSTIRSAVGSAYPVTSTAGGILSAGNPIDASKFTPEQIVSLITKQSTMVSATASANQVTLNTVSANNVPTNLLGGTITQSGTFNTANNMTVDQVRDLLNSQNSNLNQVGSGNAAILSALSAVKLPVSNAFGTLSAGSAINAASFTADQIASLINKQSTMLSATGSADSALTSGVSAFSPAILNNGGTLSLAGNINTANNMTSDQVASTVVSQLANLSQTASANQVLSGDVASNKNDVQTAQGSLIPGSALDMTAMTPQQIASLVAKQSTMVWATGSADKSLMSTVNQAGSQINAAGGSLTLNGSFNTADNMNPSLIASTLGSQTNRINITASGDRVISSTVASNQGAISALNSGSTIPGSAIDTTNMSLSDIASIIAHQSLMVATTGWADTTVSSAIDVNSSNMALNSGKIINAGSINTADNMTPDQIISLVNAQTINLSNTAIANSLVHTAVVNNGQPVSNANAILSAGSAIDTTNMTPSQIQSIAAHQSAMVNVTGSADSGMTSVLNQYNSMFAANGASAVFAGNVNTADNMTVSDVVSHYLSQANHIATVASDNSLVSAVVSANKPAISNITGVATPGSAIDVTSLSYDQLASLVYKQSIMVSATGSADNSLVGILNSVNPDITAIGGSLYNGSKINTANNMTPDQILSTIQSQNDKLSQTASGDVVISQTVSDAKPSISAIYGITTPGSTINTDNLTASQLDSIVNQQSTMVSTTASADSGLLSAIQSNSADMMMNGGQLISGSTFNTADNWTPEKISSTLLSQSKTMSATAVGDFDIWSAMDANSDQVSYASGVLKPGSTLDTEHMTLSQIFSIMNHQMSMLSATGSADSDLMSNVDSATVNFTDNGGTLKLGSTVNTADNWNPAQIASHVASQDTQISLTASGNIVISTVVSNNADAIGSASAVYTPGSALDVTKLTPSDLQSIIAHQYSMVSATGSADADIQPIVDSTAASFEQNRATLVNGGTINTASNMTVSQIDSYEKSQSAKISQTVDANNAIFSALVNNQDQISIASGVATYGSAIDTTKLTTSQINSIVSHQSQMLSVTGWADSDLTSNVNSNQDDIVNAGGSLTQTSTINTADNWSAASVTSYEKSQGSAMSFTASADRVIASFVAANQDAINNANGTLAPGSAVNVNSMSSFEIQRWTSQMKAMVDVTGSADSYLVSARDSAMPSIVSNFGDIRQSGTVNTADNMSPIEVSNHVTSQVKKISATASGDSLIYQALSQNSQTISDFYGVAEAGSVIDTTNLTSSQIRSIASQQSSMVSATGSADSNIHSISDWATSSINFNSGTISQGSTINTADNWNVSQVLSHMNSQNAIISQTGSGDFVIGTVVQSAANPISNFSGVSSYGSDIDTTHLTSSQIRSITSKQYSMVSVTASADMDIQSTRDSAEPGISMNNGVIYQSGTVNTADNWTVGSVLSHMRSQHPIISATASADIMIANALSQNSQKVLDFLGTMTYGSNIDTTHLTLSQVRSIASEQSSMISVTASADVNVKSASDAQTNNINNNNGVIAQSGTVNTADNWTVGEVLSHMQSQNLKINATGSADSMIYQALSQNSDKVSNFSGVMTYGSALNTNNLTLAQLQSIASAQSSMISVTGSADVNISLLVDSATPSIAYNNGTITLGSTVNTADNWTVGQVLNHMQSQHSIISATASADVVIGSALSANSSAVSAFNGIMTYGSVIDTTHLTSLQIRSIASEQSSMISVTATGDTNVKAASDAQTTNINNNNGVIAQSGNVNTADNWTVGEVLSHMRSQSLKINATGSADSFIYQALSQNSATVSNFSGVMTYGSALNTNDLTLDQLHSIASAQSSMISVTASADDNIHSLVDFATPSITGNQGTIVRSGTVNTADNWTVNEVLSHMQSQHSMISATASADVVISQAITKTSASILGFNGIMQYGSAIDTTHLTSLQVRSIASEQSSMISVTGSADADIHAARDSASGAIQANGGTLLQSGNVNTADNWTVNEVLSHMASQHENISVTASADVIISGAIASNSAKIANASAVYAPASAINATSLTSHQIESIAYKQSTMLSATGSADDALMSHVSMDTPQIQQAGGYLSHTSNINTADNMNPSQIASILSAQSSNMDAVASADLAVTNNRSGNDALSKPFNGGIYLGGNSVADATNWTVSDIYSNGSSQVRWMSLTASDNVFLSSTQTIAQSKAAKLGATIQQGSALDITNGLTYDQVQSITASQAATLSATGNGNDSIWSALSINVASINAAGGSMAYLGQSNAAFRPQSYVDAYASSQVENIVHAGQANEALSLTASDASDVLQRYGGGLNKNNIIDVSGSNGSQIDVIASSNVARMSAAKSATLKVSNAEQTYATMITNIGGTAQKGGTTDVTSLTPDQITPIVDRQVSVLSATGAGDVMLSNAVASANGLANRVGGTITRGADINTANMDVTDILSQASHQADNITRVGSANATIFSGLSQFSQQINSPQGSIIMVAPSDATNGQPGDMESYANSQYNNLSNVASADSYLASRLSVNVGSTTINGATMTSTTAIDGTNMTAAQLSSFVQSQTDRLDAVALANSNIRSQINTGSSGAVVNGGAIDVTGWTASTIQSNQSSQVSHISMTQRARSTIYSALSDANDEIYNIGASIGDRGSIDTTNMNGGSAVSMADSDAFRLSYVASNDSLISSALTKYRSDIRKASGAVTQGNNFNMTNWDRNLISSVAVSESQNLSAVAYANSTIQSNMDGARSGYPKTSVTVTGTVNADGWTSNQITSYGNSVAGIIAAAVQNNNQISLAASVASQFGLKESSAGSTVTISNTSDVVSLLLSNEANLSNAKSTTLSYYQSALSWMSAQPKVSATGYRSMPEGLAAVYDGSSFDMHNQAQQNIAIGVFPKPGDQDADYDTFNASPTKIDIGVIAPEMDRSHIIRTIQWDPGQMSASVVGSGLISGGGTSFVVKNNTTMKFPNAAITMDGKRLDVFVTFSYGGNYVDESKGITVGLGSGGGINSIDATVEAQEHFDQRAVSDDGPNSGRTTTYNTNYVQAKAQIVDTDDQMATSTDPTNHNFLYGMAVADIDTLQETSWSSDMHIVAMGGDLQYNGGNSIQSNVSRNLQGYSDYPNGVIGLASYGNTFTVKTANTDNKYAGAVKQSFFGRGWDLSDSVYRPHFDQTKINVNLQSLSTQYHPLDVDVYKNYQYTYNPLSTTYQAVNTNVSPISSSYNVLSDIGGYTPFTTGYNPLSTSYNSLSNIGGYNPQVYGTTPLASTYQSFSSDGTHIPPQNPDGTPNENFTGYSPISTTYKNYSTDGTKVNPYNPDGSLNLKFTGYTPLNVTYMNYSSDGNAVNPYNPDGTLNPNFTGYTPLSMTYQNYSSDGAAVKVFNPDGTISDKYTGYTPLSVTYNNYSSDGNAVNPYNPDGTLNPKFTGYTPLSLTYQNYSSDGAAVNPYNPDGSLNPKFTGYTPLDVTYMNYSSDGTKVNPYNPDGSLNDKFTGYTPLSVTYNNYSTDGTKVNPYNPDGTLNPKFTGYTPLSITYKNYSSDGTGMQTTITNENGKQIPNPKFTGYVPLSYQYSNFSSDGEKVNPYNPDGTLNKNFTGYTPLNTTYKTFSTDGSKVNPYLADGRLNPRFTGYTPLSMTYTNYSSDGTKVSPYNRDGTLNPKFTGYTPLSMTYHNYSTDGNKVNPYNPDGTLNKNFTGYTPLSGTYHPYSTDGQNIPTMITDQNGNTIPNPAFTGYSPLNVQYQTYSSDGTKVNPYNPDGSLNPKYTGYTPLTTTYKNFVTDGSKIPSTIKDSNGNTVVNPAFTGYTPLSTTYKNYTSDGSKVPSTIKDSNGNTIPNPNFTGYTPFSTTYKNYSSDGSKIPTTVTTSDGKVIPNPEFTGYAPISTTYKAFSSDGSKIPSTITDSNGNTIPNPQFTGFAPISTTTHSLSTSYKGFESDGTQVNPYNPDGSLNPKFTGYTPINTTYHPYSSDGKNILTVLPNGEINPEFTGYVPFSTDYAKDKTIYHYYNPASLQPVNPNNNNNGNNNGNNETPNNNGKTHNPDELNPNSNNPKNPNKDNGHNGNPNKNNNGSGKSYNPNDLNPKHPNKGNGNSRDHNGNGLNPHKKSNTNNHKKPIRPTVNGRYHKPNMQGQNNHVVIPNRNNGNGNNGSNNSYVNSNTGNVYGNGNGANGNNNNGNNLGNGMNNNASNGNNNLIGGSQQATLPQTGAEKQALALLGFASLTTAFGLALVGKKRKKDETK